jgi:hypothetical protein
MLMAHEVIGQGDVSTRFNCAVFSERGSIPNDGMTGSQIGRFDKMGTRR